jgi:hypothetical protein
MTEGLWDRCLVEKQIAQQERWVESRKEGE